YSFNPEAAKGNIERMIGVSQVPTGIIGPIKVNGEHARGEYMVPMSTSEGALITSYHRGAVLIAKAGGATTVITRDSIQRAPLFILKDLVEAKRFSDWCRLQMDMFKVITATTTRHGKLLDLQTFLSGHNVYVRFDFFTGDAMGMNMITKATYEICEYIKSNFSITDYVIESNMAVDKKASYLNMVMGRGKTVTAEVVIPANLLKRFLLTTPEYMVDISMRQLTATIYAGVMGCNYHIANGIAALFLANGQDLGNIV